MNGTRAAAGSLGADVAGDMLHFWDSVCQRQWDAEPGVALREAVADSDLVPLLLLAAGGCACECSAFALWAPPVISQCGCSVECGAGGAALRWGWAEVVE